MSWFLTAAVILTVIGTFFRGAGWGWVWPWSGENEKSQLAFFFGDSARAFGTLSIVLLLLLAIVPAKDHFREWLRYQSDYQKLIRNRSDGVSLAAAVSGRSATDLAAGSGSGRPLHHLPRRIEGSHRSQESRSLSVRIRRFRTP